MRLSRRVFVVSGLGGLALGQVVGCAPGVARGPSMPRPPEVLAGREHPPVAGPVTEEPSPAPPSELESTPVADERLLALPARAPDAESGSEFLRRTEGLGRAAFDEAVFEAVMAGNVPAYQRRLLPIVIASEDGRKAELHVLCDYLALGSDEDFVRMPMTSAAAQRIAFRLDAILPTTKLVDEIYRQASARLPPSYIDGGPSYGTNADFALHHQKLEVERRRLGLPLGVLIAGNKKDIVLCGRLAQRDDKVAIYGWHKDERSVIQPLSTLHSCRYADYSHGVRLVDQRMSIDGAPCRVEDVLKDPELADLLSAEGPLLVTAYPTELPELAPSRAKKKAKGSRSPRR